MLETIKLALRYRSNNFDDEIKMYVNACKSDLVLAGIKQSRIVDYDDNIKAVCIAYCKWQLDYQGKGERWQGIYKSMKTSLALNKNYVH